MNQKKNFLCVLLKEKEILLVIKIKVVYLQCQTTTTTGRFPRTLKFKIMSVSIFNGLERTTKEINMNFRIKVNGIVDGKKINTLVGVSGLIKLVGIEMANKMIRRAFYGKGDKMECKLRRCIKVVFYSK